MSEIIKRATVIIYNPDLEKYLIIRRHKNGQDYYAIPGGGIEVGETPREAALREVSEELGLSLRDLTEASNISTPSRYDIVYTATTADTEIVVTGEEKSGLTNPENLFQPSWYSTSDLDPTLPIYPIEARKIFLEVIKNQ